MSAKGLAFLSAQEGLRLAPYNDSAGHATIGVGHLIHLGPVTAADRTRYRGFTRADAIRLLKKDVASREAAVRRLITVELNQNEFDSLVSLVFNIGEGGFAGSTVRRKLNAGDRRGAADAFLMWRVGGPGLIFRRQRERKLFLKPVPKRKPPLWYLTDREREVVKEFDALKKVRNPKAKQKARMRELKAWMTKRRKVIWKNAKTPKPDQWDKFNRRPRYNALLARTR